jgi:hypothetical protein
MLNVTAIDIICHVTHMSSVVCFCIQSGFSVMEANSYCILRITQPVSYAALLLMLM